MLQAPLTGYAATIGLSDPIWQPKYYAFNVWSQPKVHEKLTYMRNVG